MDYNKFSKAELIEAIKHNNDGIGNYRLNQYLIFIQGQKSTDILREMDKINQQIKAATTTMEVYKLEKKFTKLDMELDKIYRKLDVLGK